jgi:hypothetical protein
MAIKRYAGDKLVGLSSDTKPTNIPDGANFYETNTLDEYILTGGAWVKLGVSGTVTSVTGTAPIVSSGGVTPALSISAATTSAAGSMSSSDKTKLDGIASGATAITNLDSLSDVVVASPTSGQVLKYNGTNWVNDTDATGSGGGITTGKAIAMAMIFG